MTSKKKLPRYAEEFYELILKADRQHELNLSLKDPSEARTTRDAIYSFRADLREFLDIFEKIELRLEGSNVRLRKRESVFVSRLKTGDDND